MNIDRTRRTSSRNYRHWGERELLPQRLAQAVEIAKTNGESPFTALETRGLLIGTVVPREDILFDLVDDPLIDGNLFDGDSVDDDPLTDHDLDK